MTKIDEIKETFSLLDDWEDRYSYLIDLGKKLPEYPETLQTQDHLVEGCTSQVWMDVTILDDTLTIRATSDAHIVRGLVALIVAIYDGVCVSDAQKINVEAMFETLGLSEHLSPNRRNGFFAMVEKIKKILS